jgi:tetratricopeptide (TPR) repeat protein
VVRTASCIVAAAVSLSGLQTQNRTGQAYRDIVEEFRATPDPAIEKVLDLPAGAVASGIDDATRSASVWPLASRGAALVMHTDAALYLRSRDRSAAWVHLERAQTLADALAQDPESAWLVHQWFIVVNVAFKDDARVNAVVERWHAAPWYAATAAMDRGLDLEASGSMFGVARPGRGTEIEVYDPDAFRQAAPFYKAAIAAHLEIAAVHLGRIELLRGHPEEARRLFAQAARDSHWRTTTYLANLFLGSMAERDGERAEAERRYRLSLAALRGAQSARVALAALLARTGQTAEAARVLADRPGDFSSPESFDPWWAYTYPYWDRRTGYRVLLSELHAAVSR